MQKPFLRTGAVQKKKTHFVETRLDRVEITTNKLTWAVDERPKRPKPAVPCTAEPRENDI